MKKYLYILIILAFTIVNSNAQQKKSIDLNWQTDFEKAKLLASTENKNILIYFTGYDRINSCNLLNKDFFYTEKFQKIAKKYLILVRVNTPKREDAISEEQKIKNTTLSKRYNQKVHPTVILTDAKGKQLGKVESYNYLHDTSKHYALIEKEY